MKVDKSKNYIVTFAHSLDDTDTMTEALTGKGYFIFRNVMRDLGYLVKEIEEITE